ncbi:MAG: hypothetical protein NDJ90_11955 [Oligoflexia bacterium]|nr:hypothetical protein [Oligoflexia bacterium]
MSEFPGIDRWLVRTEKNQLLGPFSREEVRKQIQEGRLGLQDEVCQGNHYWIYLHEREEVMAQLGLELPRYSSEEEITETDMAYRPLGSSAKPYRSEARIAAQGPAPEPAVERLVAAMVEDSEIPELAHDELQDALTENTAVLTNRALREFRRREEQAPVIPQPVVDVPLSSAPIEAEAPRPAVATAPEAPTEESFFNANVTSAVESSSYFQNFPWVLVAVVSALMAGAVWMLLKS